jgi:phosphoglycolate phosphatase-like HAD superfamily hydrolase
LSDVAKIFKSFEVVCFDFDGVIIDSNKIKSEAFFEVAKRFSIPLAEKLVSLNDAMPGISRYQKFAEFRSWFPNPDADLPTLDDLIKKFSYITLRRLRRAKWDTAVLDLRKINSHQKWFLISGADEKDLLKTCSDLGITSIFDGGIFGSPKPKLQIFQDLAIENALVIGDGLIDFECAQKTNSDFVFVKHWATSDSLQYFETRNVYSVDSLSDLKGVSHT